MNELELVLRDVIPEIMISTSLDGKIREWDSDAEQFFGFSLEEVAGKFLHNMLVPSGRVKDEQALLQQTLAHGFAEQSCLWRHKDGRLIQVRISNRVARQGPEVTPGKNSTPASVRSASADLLILKSIHVEDPRVRLLAIFDVLGLWISGSDLQNHFPNPEAEMRQSLVEEATTHQLSSIDSLIHQLAVAAGLFNPDEFVHIWQILMNGAIIAARQGNTDSAAEVRRAALVVLEEWGKRPDPQTLEYGKKCEKQS